MLGKMFCDNEFKVYIKIKYINLLQKFIIITVSSLWPTMV